MDPFDDKLQRALRGQRIEIGGDEIGSARGLVTELFKFRSRLITAGALVKLVAFLAGVLVCFVCTFTAGDADARFLWAFGCLVSLIGLGIQWQFYWMMLNRNAVLRELKRLELLLVDRAAD